MPTDNKNRMSQYGYTPGILDQIGKKGIDNIFKKESGFFDLPASPASLCNSPHHKPPSHLYIPQGKGYRHVCPACNQVTEIIPPQYK